MVETITVTLTFRDLQINVATGDRSETLLQVKILDDFLHDRESGLSSAQQRALYIDFKNRHRDLDPRRDRKNFTQVLRHDPYFNALRAKFGYAVTCHKAQGGEWSHVIVSCRADKEPRNADNFRWLYTAMTRSSQKLYLLNPPEIRIKIVGWSNPEQQVLSERDAATSEKIDTESLSPHKAFQQNVLAKVRELLDGAGIAIDDVAHHQFQEAFYLRRNAETARVNISYNGKFKIGAIATPQTNPLSDQLRSILEPLNGKAAATPIQAAPSNDAAHKAPSRPFLRNFHDRLLSRMDARQIRVTDLKEHAWHQCYGFARGNEAVEVNIYFDSKDRFKSCMPINVDRFAASAGKLLPEVLEVIASEIIP